MAVETGVADLDWLVVGEVVTERTAVVLADTVVFEEGGAGDVFEAEGAVGSEAGLGPILGVGSVLTEDVAGDGLGVGSGLGELEGNADIKGIIVEEMVVIMNVDAKGVFAVFAGDVELRSELAIVAADGSEEAFVVDESDDAIEHANHVERTAANLIV